MKLFGKSRLRFRFCLLLLLALTPHSVFACAACYGQSDSPLANGFNWGILSLLGVVMIVLGCITSFFVYLGKRSAAIAAAPDSQTADPRPSTLGPQPTLGPLP